MPTDQSTWLVSIPHDGDSEWMLQELASKLAHTAKLPIANVSQILIPSFKTGTLDNLIALSEELPKKETFFTSTVAKNVDALRNLLNNDPIKLAQHILVDERSVDNYLLKQWKWNEGRYSVHRSLSDLVAVLSKEMTSIDISLKKKLTSYNLVKGTLSQMQRTKTGNLSNRALSDIVHKDDFIDNSEHLETILVAVPRTSIKEWKASYERLAPMVVPRSAKEVTKDDDFVLYSVVLFKRSIEEFNIKCRDNKFTVRDFKYSEETIVKGQQEFNNMLATEKELWTELLRLARINFSESFQILVHLKVLRLFVESVLRYGLPSDFTGFAVKPEPKTAKKVLVTLQTQFKYLSPRSNPVQGQLKKGAAVKDELTGELQTLMDQEFFNFVMFEVPWIL